MDEVKEEMMSLKKQFLIFVALLVLIIASAPTMATESRPVQVSLFTPVQIFEETYPITGVRLSILYGRSISITGLDLGLVNHTTTGITKGLQHGAVGLTDYNFVGWQNNIVNVVKGDFEGFQSGVVNHAKFVNGVQLGLVNYAGSMKGLQIGLVNIIGQGGAFPVFPIVNWSF